MSGQFVLPMKQSTCSWVSINCPVDLEWWPSLLVRQWRIAKWTTSSFFFWRIAQSMVIWWFEVQVCWWLTIIGMSARNTSIHIPKIGLTTNVANNQLTIGWLYNKGQCINNPPKKLHVTPTLSPSTSIHLHRGARECYCQAKDRYDWRGEALESQEQWRQTVLLMVISSIKKQGWSIIRNLKNKRWLWSLYNEVVNSPA